MKNPKIQEKKTLRPFIITSRGICNGSPVIRGTRTRVIDIAIEYDRIGYTPDQIVDAHPHLDLVKVHNALSYYYENRERLDEEITSRREHILQLKKEFPSKLGY
jgi:uncharacterized protein (DUF433 family)